MKQLCTRRWRAAGQVLAALGLDVEDLHSAKALDARDLQALGIAGCLTAQIEAALQLDRFGRVDEPDLIGKDTAIASGLDAHCPVALTVCPRVPLKADPGEDTEAEKELLNPADELFGDHVNLYHGRSRPTRHEALRLEDASQVGGHYRERGHIQMLRHHHVRAPGE